MFWHVVINTVVFTVGRGRRLDAVGLAVALLMRRVSGWARIVVTISLMFVWAMPQIVATQVFAWMVDSDFGVVNFGIDKMPGVNFENHSWFATPAAGLVRDRFAGALGRDPVPGDHPLRRSDAGAAGTRRGRDDRRRERLQVLRNVLVPILKPVLIIATTLSVIWDFQVFNQIYVVRNGQPEQSYWTIGIYAYEKAFGESDYNTGATISLITMILLLFVMVFYVRQMIRIGEAD